MDYKYIEQLLERYWQCETTLQEEDILRAFFAQDNVPVWLEKYKQFFVAETEMQDIQPLDDDFDRKILSMIENPVSVHARTISLTQRLIPLFKAAAVVAIILTLGNAAQAPWDRGWEDPKAEYAKYHAADSTQMLQPMQAENIIDSMQIATPVAPTY
jgi:hypothetical protein